LALGNGAETSIVGVQQQILRCAKDDNKKGKVKDKGPDSSLCSE